MELYVFNHSDRKLAGIIEAYEYLRWTRRYSFCGSFELIAIATPENAALLKEGNILRKSDDEEAGIIERVELSQTERELVIASGRFATSLLARRIVWGTEILSGDISAAVGRLLNNHLLSPTDIARRITGISYTPATLGVSVRTQTSYRNLLDTVSDLCDGLEVGIKTVFNPATGHFAVTLYRGGNSSAVFSKEYENLTEQVYIQSVDEYANTALVGGEGEGAGRTFVTITQGSGENRREVFVDARDLQSEDFPGTYTDALLFRGRTRLAELAPRYSYDAGINPHGNLRYKVDYNLGDVVKVQSNSWGAAMTARITEIEETHDAEGVSLQLIFGKAELTIAQKMRSDISDLRTTLMALPDSFSIADGSVTSAKIAAGAVNTAAIANNSVTTVKIADLAVTAAKIANSTITSGKFAAGAVNTAAIADLAVTAAKIANATITSAKLAAGAVATVDIQDLAVTTAKLANGAVTTAKTAQEAETSISISWATGVSLAGTQNSFINKGVVCIGFQVQISSGSPIAPGGLVCTINTASFRPYATVRSVFIPVPVATATATPLTIETNGAIRNAASGTTLPGGYYIISVTYARA